jgi:hypothetical protein
MKRTKHCPKCQSRRIGHLAEQLDRDDNVVGSGKDAGVMHEARSRAVGYVAEERDTGFFNYGVVRPVVGKLEAYVCTDCGYHESYVVEPRTIEWDRLVGFSWVNPETGTDGPFR